MGGRPAPGNDTRIRILPLPDDFQRTSKSGRVLPPPDPNSKRSQAKRKWEVWVRIGSTGKSGREPIWSKALVYIDREPPPGTRIKWVYIRRLLFGRSERWSVQFVLSREEWTSERAEAGTVGVNVNWRKFGNRLRVATFAGSDDTIDSLYLPDRLVSAWQKAESLATIRKRNFNESRDILIANLKALPPESLPEPIAEALKYMHLWQSPARMAELVWKWKDARFPGDESALTLGEAWRKQDRHLHDWQCAARAKADATRNTIYRQFARRLARAYASCSLADIDYAALRRTPEPGEVDAAFTRLYAGIAAPGLLTRYIKEACAAYGEADATNITKQCASCGTVNDFDAGKSVFCACSGCGVEFDIDENAARNLLAAAAREEPAEANG